MRKPRLSNIEKRMLSNILAWWYENYDPDDPYFTKTEHKAIVSGSDKIFEYLDYS